MDTYWCSMEREKSYSDERRINCNLYSRIIVLKKGQMNWDYSHSDNSWPVVHAFIPGSDTFNDYPILKQKLSNLQQVESNNHLRGGIVNLYNTIDTGWLIACKKLGYRYACVWFDGIWADTEDFNLTLLKEIDRLNNTVEKGWFVAGQIKQDDDYSYPYFYRSMILINIDAWIENEEPNPFIDPSDLPYFATIPELDWEDSMFALYPTDEEKNKRDFSKQNNPRLTRFANSWIAWSLRRRLTVPGFSEELVQTIKDTRPHVGTEDFDAGIQGLAYDKDKLSYQANRVVNSLKATSPIYFVNTEKSKPEIVEQLEGTTFDQYVGPCAGFKLLYYAFKYGFNKNTRFVFYDFDPDSVQFKIDMFKNWDGTDFPEFVDKWCEANPNANNDLQYAVRDNWAIVIDMFGGPDKFVQFWNEVRNCDNRFIVADVVDSSDNRLSNSLVNVRTLFWTSNIYSYILAKMNAKPFALEQSFINLITTLNEFPDSWFVGTDINDNEIMCPSKAVTTVGENYNLGFE